MDIVKFIFLAPSPTLIQPWERAFKEHNLTRLNNLSFVQSKLEDLSEEYRHFDCIVSPANSYGRMDGSFDFVLSLALCPKDPLAPTRVAQKVLYAKWRGYAPPGTCTLVPLNQTSCYPNQHSCRYIALCPTMRIPESVTWNRELVYNCVWSLLNELAAHNSDTDGSNSEKITSVLMTGLATGVGGISAERFAQQTALAFKHFYDASENEEKWSSMSWYTAKGYAAACSKTHGLVDRRESMLSIGVTTSIACLLLSVIVYSYLYFK